MKWHELKEKLKDWDEGKFDFTEETAKTTLPELPPPILDKREYSLPIPKIAERETVGFKKIYPFLAAILALGMSAFLLYTVCFLPHFGVADAPQHNEVTARYNGQGLMETGAVNIVAGVILDYRAFDTLGESHVLFTAATAVMILLMLLKDGEAEAPETRAITEKDPILRHVVTVIFPLIMVFGIYVMFNGHLGPGGGFSGGAIIGGGLILYVIAFGFGRLEKILNLKTFRIIVLSALCFYSIAKCYSFFSGANGLETIFTTGTPGAIFSAGLILPLNLAVGIVVACTMYGFYSIFTRGKI